MHIGLIGGIGPASTAFYYRTLVQLYARTGRRLELTIVNAELREMVTNLETGDGNSQAMIFAGLIDQLKAGGCEAAALTSMGGHFCIKELEAVSTLPLISILPVLSDHFRSTGVRRAGVLGTRAVMESGMYGISAVEVVTLPEAELSTAHAQYLDLASSGTASKEQRAYFERAALRLVREYGAEAVVLAGTDLFLAFDQQSYPYRLVDCAQVHAEAIAKIGMDMTTKPS